MDILADVLSLLRTKGHLYGRLEFTAPWGFQFSNHQGICLMVTHGSCFLGVNRQPLLPLAAGDFVFLTEPNGYTLQDSLNTPVRHIHEVTTPEEFHKSRLIAAGGGGMPTSLIAGGFTFATPESEWLVKDLPTIIHVSASEANSSPWFESTFQFVASEVAQDRPGSTVIVDRLAEVLFVQALRTRIQAPGRDENPGWLRALADPQIGAALRLMYAEPGVAWTVPELARRASMSRSSFAARFRERVGDTPLDHLTQWRMVRAASIMRDNRLLTLAAVASAVGYESESAFGKVFRRVIGVSPGQYRKNHTDQTFNTKSMGEGIGQPWTAFL